MTDGLSRTSGGWDRGDDGVWTLWFDCPGRSHNVLDRRRVRRARRLPGRDRGRRPAVQRAPDPQRQGRGILRRGRSARRSRACRVAAELETFLRRGLAVLDRLARLKVPTVAVVHGVCLGGGLELALACRFRVALASNVPLQLGCPEVQLGLIPAWGAIARLPRLLAPRDALNLLLTGNPIGFLQAKSQGLVDRLVSQDEQARIAEMLDPRSRPRTVPSPAGRWHDELEFAQAKADDQPADFPEVQD